MTKGILTIKTLVLNCLSYYCIYLRNYECERVNSKKISVRKNENNNHMRKADFSANTIVTLSYLYNCIYISKPTLENWKKKCS